MNEIVLNENSGIIVENIDLLTANTPFTHVDRIASFNVLIYVTSGCIYVSEEGEDYAVNPGEVILLKQGTHQYGTKQIDAGTSWIYAHFYTGRILNGSETYDSSQIFDNTDSYSPNNILLPKFIKGLEKTDIPHRLDKLIRLSETNKTLSKNRVSSSFHNILLDLYDQAQIKSSPTLSEQIIDYIQDNIFEDLVSSKLEDHFHLTYKYLTRAFSNDIGMGIMQYYIKLKLQTAAKELRSTNKSITEISEELHFNDPLYFSKCFKKQYDLSPREYRKKQLIEAFLPIP